MNSTSTRLVKQSTVGLLLGGALLLFLPATVLIRAEDPPPAKPTVGIEGYRLVPLDEWKRLQDELKRLRERDTQDKPSPPSSCKLTGKVAGEVVHLQARFELITTRPRSSVLLACPQGFPSSTTLDGQTATGVSWGEKGWTVQVEKADPHVFGLDMDVPLETRDGEHGFELTLPGAYINSLDLELPSGVKAVRLGNRTVVVDPGTARIESRLGPGAVEKLEVFWDADPNRPPAPPSFSVESRMRVTIAENLVTTQADLTVKLLGGKADGFWLLADAAEIAAGDGSQADIRSDSKSPSANAHFVVLKPGATQVKLKISSSQPIAYVQSRNVGNIALPQFVVVGAVRQRGTVSIGRPSADLQVRHIPRANASVTLSPRELKDEEPNVVMAFSYWNLAVTQKPAQTVAPLLNLEIEKVKPPVDMSAVYAFSLETGEHGEPAWRLRADLKLTFSTGGGTEPLFVRLPPEFQYEAAPGQSLEAGNRLRIVVDKPERKVPAATTSVSFEGKYPALSPGTEETVLKLPVVEGANDRDSEIKVETPRGYKLVPARANDPTWDAANTAIKLAASRSPQQHSWTPGRLPEKVELAWRPHLPEVPARSSVDLLIGERQVRVLQTISVRTWQGAVDRLVLRVPVELTDRVRVIGADGQEHPLGARDLAEKVGQRRGHSLWQLELKSAGPGASVILKYYFATSEAGPKDFDRVLRQVWQTFVAGSEIVEPDRQGPPELAVPLVRPEQVNGDQVNSLETVVRVFARPGTQAVLPDRYRDRWEELPAGGAESEALEPLAQTRAAADPARHASIPKRPKLQPESSFRSRGLDVHLALSLEKTGGPGLAAAVVETALVRVRVGEDGKQSYRISLRFGRLRGPSVDLELPVSSANLNNLRVALRSGEPTATVTGLHWIDDIDAKLGSSRLLRVEFDPYVISDDTVLEISYDVPTSRTQLGGLFGTTRLQPVLVRGDLGLGEVRWDIVLPNSWLPLLRSSETGSMSDAGDLGADMGWGLRGWLLGPRALRSHASLERWFRAGATPADAPAPADTHPTLIVHATGLESISLTHVPQQSWLLGCSLSLVGWVFGLWLARRQPVVFWCLLLGGVLAASVAAVFWPGVFVALVYGLQPGAVVVVALLLVQWAARHRYRRQVVFMPGFQRVKSGSSLVRSSQQRQRSEAVPKDVPVPAPNAWAADTVSPSPAPVSSLPQPLRPESAADGLQQPAGSVH